MYYYGANPGYYGGGYGGYGAGAAILLVDTIITYNYSLSF